MIQMILKNMMEDLWEAAKYLPFCVIIGIALSIVIFKIECKKNWKKEQGWKTRGIRVCFVIYLLEVGMITFFSREPGSRRGIDWLLFSTWGTNAKNHAFVLENILLFIPLGVLLPLKNFKFQRVQSCVLAGFYFSCGIEIMQLLTGRGFCQLDDVVMNTLGTWIGFRLFCAVKKRFHILKGR